MCRTAGADDRDRSAPIACPAPGCCCRRGSPTRRPAHLPLMVVVNRLTMPSTPSACTWQSPRVYMTLAMMPWVVPLMVASSARCGRCGRCRRRAAAGSIGWRCHCSGGPSQPAQLGQLHCCPRQPAAARGAPFSGATVTSARSEASTRAPSLTPTTTTLPSPLAVTEAQPRLPFTYTSPVLRAGTGGQAGAACGPSRRRRPTAAGPSCSSARQPRAQPPTRCS